MRYREGLGIQKRHKIENEQNDAAVKIITAVLISFIVNSVKLLL